MISEKQARAFAESAFPEAPEKLATRLGVEVRYSALSGCDGWCLASGAKRIIRINNALPPVRQRFTLAHELGHLILHVATVVGETYEDMLRPNSAEERRVNDLASALLIPANVARKLMPEPPVVMAAVQRLAKKANVSDLAAAVRVCNLAQQIGLSNASVVRFDGERVRWHWSTSISMTDKAAVELLSKARRVAPKPYRHAHGNGKVVVASMIENPSHCTATLFVQLLPEQDGLRLSAHEQRLEVERMVFEKNPELRSQVNGCLGYFKNIRTGSTREEAVAEFWQRYETRFKHTPLSSKAGKAYVRLRISEWY